MGKASNRPAVERLIERNRRDEKRNAELTQGVATHIQMINAYRSDARVEALRRRKAAIADFEDFATELASTVQEKEAQQKIKGAELQHRVTSRLGEQHQKLTNIDLQRQKVCMESEEIRKLKEQLATAKVNRERAAQLLERQVREVDAAMVDARLNLAMEEERLAECEKARRRELERNLQMRRVGEDLADQITARRRMKQEETAKKYASEQEQVGAVVAKLLEEMEDERRQLAERRQMHAILVQEVTKERERQKQRLREEKLREESEIREYLEMQRKRTEDLAREKELVRREKARVLNELLQSQLQKQKEETDYAQLVAELYTYERDEQERQKEEAQKQKRQEEKALLLAAFKEQMEEKERQRQVQLAVEGKFRQELLAKFAREVALEQMTQQRRKLAILEHNKQVLTSPYLTLSGA
ncbi:meiosis-specific nuclear structural protein [Cyclospora cayetanensis]|uniref:Meiosis-specific nuclear structural protein 1 n=1 Tax=Cyclospora cayetanensis TaxID=88456 RepID=A0A1D3D855_9EIME|nr:meiosis-specific nuclear structural protein [Cyclospora cayetanensis]